MGGLAVGALASHLCGPWLDSQTGGHVSRGVFLVISLASRVILQVLRFFLPLQKSTLLNSNLDSVDEEPLCGNATANCIYLFIYLFNQPH
jgi:hypothetical protein